MKAPHLSRENRMTASAPERMDVNTFEAPLKNKVTQGRAAESTYTPSAIEPISERFPALEEQEVMLEFLAPEASNVTVAGKFNNWNPRATPLKNNGLGEWVVRLMLRSGQYEYRFVVDGLWIEDPEATQRVENPRGGFNSVLVVPLIVKTSML